MVQLVEKRKKEVVEKAQVEHVEKLTGKQVGGIECGSHKGVWLPSPMTENEDKTTRHRPSADVRPP